jgi:hypothetical protein
MLRLGIAIALTTSCLFFMQSNASRFISSQPSTLQISHMNNSIDFELIDVGYNPLVAGFEPEPKIVIFRNQQEWNNFWRKFSFLDVNLNEQKLPVPSVDFEQKMVIGLTIGSRPTGGYSIQIDCIEQLTDSETPQWLIHYTEITPSENCPVTQQPITPNVFILTQNSNAAINLNAKNITSSCSS